MFQEWCSFIKIKVDFFFFRSLKKIYTVKICMTKDKSSYFDQVCIIIVLYICISNLDKILRSINP